MLQKNNNGNEKNNHSFIKYTGTLHTAWFSSHLFHKMRDEKILVIFPKQRAYKNNKLKGFFHIIGGEFNFSNQTTYLAIM